jgi:hypothetical protein
MGPENNEFEYCTRGGVRKIGSREHRESALESLDDADVLTDGAELG